MMKMLPLLLVVSSCAFKSDGPLLQSRLRSLYRAERFIAGQNKNPIFTLAQKAQEYQTEVRANRWLVVQRKGDSVCQLVLDQISELQERMFESRVADAFAKQDTGAAPPVRRLEKGALDSLSYALDTLSARLGSLSDVLIEELSGINFVDCRRNALSSVRHDVSFLNHEDAIGQFIFLQQLKVNVQTFRGAALMICSEQVGAVSDGYEKFSALIGQNLNVLNPGGELIVNAGIGAFSAAAKPTFRINNRIIEMNESGQAVYKTRVQLKSGHYSVPVSIAFTDPDGRKQIVTRKVNYEVFDRRSCPDSTQRKTP